jgi:hypothetical protein
VIRLPTGIRSFSAIPSAKKFFKILCNLWPRFTQKGVKANSAFEQSWRIDQTILNATSMKNPLLKTSCLGWFDNETASTTQTQSILQKTFRMKATIQNRPVSGDCRLSFVVSILCALLAILPPTPGQSATLVSGLVEAETWTAANSPYLVVGDVQVDSLLIHSNVVVQFQGNYVFQVTGFLMATGAVFTTTNTAVGWQGIFFNEVANGSVLDSCVVERSRNSGIRIEDCLPEIVNCVVRDNSASQGGGVNINNTVVGLGEIVLTGCSVSNNTASLRGGGISALLGNNRLNLMRCFISENIAGNPPPSGDTGDVFGGGVRVVGNSTLLDCVIAGNRCYACASSGQARRSWGGGVYSASGNARFENCILTNNIAQAGVCTFGAAIGRGGAIYADGGSLTNVNCIIAFNTAIGQEGPRAAAVHLGTPRVAFVNCTIVHNSEEAIDGSATVQNSIVFFNNSGGIQMMGVNDVRYSDVQGGILPGLGNKSVNPSLGPDFRITASSQCVDMGDPNPIYNDTCFPPSRGTSRNDMGAHGGPGACGWVECMPVSVESQPQSRIVCEGQEVTFSVTATGSGLRYQWYFNTNTPLAGATGSVLTLTNVQLAAAGIYHVVVSDNCGNTVASAAASLGVTDICVAVNLHACLTMSNLVAGQPYRVEHTTTPEVVNSWSTTANFTATGPNELWCDPAPAHLPRRFYRVVRGQ